MKISSVNIRDVGGIFKRDYLIDLIKKEEVDMICIHETKTEYIHKEVRFTMLGSNNIE